MLFDIRGAKVPQLACAYGCVLYGDAAPAYCIVDVDDILYVLDAFSDADPLVNFAGSDLFPCENSPGTLDVDDILAILEAFVGNYACPHPCPPGACCAANYDCREGLTESACGLLDDGAFLGPFSNCAETTGACCGGTAGGCTDVTESACEAQGGSFFGTCTSCGGPPGACCHAGDVCDITSRCACDDLEGTYFGDGAGCSWWCCLPAECHYIQRCQCIALGGTMSPGPGCEHCPP